MRKTLLRLSSVLGALAVITGAFGAHSLESLISAEAMSNFETGVQYHFVHTLALLGTTALLHLGKKTFLWYAGWAFAIGILLFSGSLYLLSLRDILPISTGLLGPITPIGGVAFIVGWVFLFLSSYQEAKRVKGRKKSRRKEEVSV